MDSKKQDKKNVQGTSTATENEDSEDELDNLKSSYVLTMSQSVCGVGNRDGETENANTEYVFEAIGEVRCTSPFL